MRPLGYLLLGVALTPSAAGAQSITSDSARLVVMQDGQPVGTEDFAFRVQSVGGQDGVTFVATTTVGAQGGLRAAVTETARRITVRIATTEGETGREYPGGSTVVVADERVLSLFALLARRTVGAVTVYGPPPGGRRPGTLEAAGEGRLPGVDMPLRRLVLRSGEDVVNVWLDERARLFRVEIPARGLSAERVATEP